MGTIPGLSLFVPLHSTSVCSPHQRLTCTFFSPAQLLTEMDGFEAEQRGIVVLGATNRKDVLDAALTRPGRFDRSIEVRRPDYQGRVEAIAVSHKTGVAHMLCGCVLY